MEDDQEVGHACRFCGKHFPCGRSLGGHMRSHLRSSSTSPATSEKKEKKPASLDVNGGTSSNNPNTLEASGHVGYGLRENPKKTWRLSDSIDASFQYEKYCKECGRGFQSSNALSGHMRSHSGKERVGDSVEDDLWIGGDRKLIVDSQSDTETRAPRRRRRSRRSRYRYTSAVSVTAAASFANASSSVSDVVDEQEEVAMSLVMLSRDVRHWAGVNSVGEASDNNSALVEVGSSGLVKMSSGNVDHGVKVKNLNDKKLNCIQSGLNGGNSSSGCLRNGSVVSIDRPTKECKLQNPKCDEEDGLKVSNTELGKDLILKAEYQTYSECGKYNSGKRTRESSNCKMLEEFPPKKLKCGTMDFPNKYKCKACNKTFHSFQALGGHRTSHRKAKCCPVSKTESCETSVEITADPDSRNDGKLIKSCSTQGSIQREVTSYSEARHQCGICFQVFASGQALGGHKRRHVLESSVARGKQAAAIVQQPLPVIHNLLDLNLPAPVDEEANAGTGTEPWWVGSNHKHEQAVALS